MWLVLFRLVVVLLLAHAGYVYTPLPARPWIGLALGLLMSAVVIGLELRLRAVPAYHLVGALVGGVIGLCGARLVWAALDALDLLGVTGEHFIQAVVVVFLGYIGIVVGGQHGEWFEPARIIAAFRDSSRLHQYKILDTSVIIDGRIADICETGFLDGTLVVPQFVLRELQQVADSSDSLKRNRGRRGLDILQRIQKMAHVHVQIVETDFPEVREVDLKLIELARRMNAKIVTNDFNLNKVAQLRGVNVLNINELANSLKPVVLPGEVMRVFVIKEGKEAGQGVAYLDDGTMVVVDQAKKALGKTIEVCVTSVLQTTAGKMIFCRWIDAPPLEEPARRDLRMGDRRDPRNGRDYRTSDRRETDRREGDRRETDRRDERSDLPGAFTAAEAGAAPSVEGPPARPLETGPGGHLPADKAGLPPAAPELPRGVGGVTPIPPRDLGSHPTAKAD